MVISDYIFMLTLSLTAICDVWKRKIPNILLFTGTALIIVSGEAGGEGGILAKHLLTALTAAALVFPLYIMRMTGAGDIKLLAFVFFTKGVEEGILISLIALFTAGAWSLVKLFRSGRTFERFSYLYSYLRVRAVQRNIRAYYIPERDGREITVPLALFVLAGAALQGFFTI